MKVSRLLLCSSLLAPLWAQDYARCVGIDASQDEVCDEVYKCGNRPITEGYEQRTECHSTGTALCAESDAGCRWEDPNAMPAGPIEADTWREVRYRERLHGLCVDFTDIEPSKIRKNIEVDDVPLGSGSVYSRALDFCMGQCTRFRHECQAFSFPRDENAVLWCTLYGPAMTQEIVVERIPNANDWRWQLGEGVDVAQAYSLDPAGRDVECFIKDRRIFNADDEGIATISEDAYVCVYNTVLIDTPSEAGCSGDTCAEDASRAAEVCSPDCQLNWPTSTGCDNKSNGDCRFFENIDGVWCQCEKCDVAQERLRLSCTGCTTVVYNNDRYGRERRNTAGTELVPGGDNRCVYDGVTYTSDAAVASRSGCENAVRAAIGPQYENAATGRIVSESEYQALGADERGAYTTVRIDVSFNAAGAPSLALAAALAALVALW